MSCSIKDVKGYPHKRPIYPAPPGPDTTKGSLPDPHNVQGDVYLTLPKRFERFLFFQIEEVTCFRVYLGSYVLNYITNSATTAERIEYISKHKGEDLDYESSNIAFSRAGLNKLNITAPLLDTPFDSSATTTKPDGVILVTAKTQETCDRHSQTIVKLFKDSISVLENLDGHVREGGREFFGWRDGISQPALDKLVDPKPGQLVVPPGVIILGYPDDPEYGKRPPFTKDGSFLVYTRLRQDVWLFNSYVEQNWRSVPANPAEGYFLSDAQRKSLFCARLFGRFASGVPLALSPYIDDPAFLSDDLIDYFNYAERPRGTGCPLFAHTLKTNPRSVDLAAVPEDVVKESVIVRAGIPYGPEFSDTQPDNCDRGLLFVSYQASITNGFLRQLNHWSRQDGFPPGFGPVGQDPIIGDPQQVWDSSQGQGYNSSLAPPPEYVRQLDGGLYFTPSISTVQSWVEPPNQQCQ